MAELSRWIGGGRVTKGSWPVALDTGQRAEQVSLLGLAAQPPARHPRRSLPVRALTQMAGWRRADEDMDGQDMGGEEAPREEDRASGEDEE